MAAAIPIAGCTTGHIQIEPPAPQLTDEQRVELFNRLVPVGIDVVLARNCGGSDMLSTCRTKVDSESLILGDGRVVRHAEDLLPVLPPGSEAAEHARGARRADRYSAYFGISGVAVGVAGTVTWYLSRADAANNVAGSDTGQTVGLAMLAGGVVVGVVGAWIFHVRSEHHTAAAFEHYPDALAERLDVCIEGLKVVACHASPETDRTHEEPSR